MNGSRPLAGQNVVVTRGTGGIGKATAMGLAALSARVGIVGRDRARAEAAAEDLRRGSVGEIDVTGGYFHDRRPERASRASLDRATAKRLWQVSEELVGVSW
jgi:NAD(P)-dependent dehydrogenase (short-subunit alcohol dehydrogenase family)